MSTIFEWANNKLTVDKRLIAIYCLVYLAWGLMMNWIGIQLEIAKFTFWWQVVTCYIVYMVPISLLLRKLPFHMQYAYGLVAMAFLEFGGYLFETSYVYPNNLLDQFINIRNFSLGMALFFALYFPFGNWGVGELYGLIFKEK